MSSFNKFHKKHPSPLVSYVRWLYLFFVFILILFSCKRKGTYTNTDYSSGFKDILQNVNKLFDAKKANEGIRYLDSTFRLINPTLNDRFRYYGMHFVYSKKTLHDGKQELLYADSMLQVAQKSLSEKQNVANYAEANFAKGDAYFDLRQYSDAYRCFYEGYFLGKNYLDNAVLAEYTYRMGMVTFRQSHYKLAANYFKESYKQSLAYHDDFRSFYQRQELLNDIGESYQQDGNVDSARLYFGRTIDYINQNAGRFKSKAALLETALGVTYGDLGAIYFTEGQYEKAKSLLKKSIAINTKKFNDNYNSELVEINLARLYLKQNNVDSLFNLLTSMRRQLDTAKNQEAETDWNSLMSNYYMQKKDFTKAFAYFKNYSQLKDSLNRESTSLKETDVNQQLANYDKQYQIESLKDDNKLQQIYLYLAIICVIMAVIIIFLVYRNWKRSKNDISVISALNRQISSQKKDLETTLNELKVNSQEKDRILRTVAHDLRNPIGGIVSLTNAMLEDEYNEEQKQLISLVNGTSFNSLELINEILEATNTTAGKLNKEMVEVNALVNNSVEILGFKAAEKDQKIVTGLLAKPKKLLISRERIWRVISNLISNAIKFSPNGTTIHVNVSQNENEVKISVSDEGIGIPDNIRDEVFNIFTNAKRPGTAGEKSFGLGLSICQQIIENHKGKIWFEDNKQKGTTFYISLPSA